VTISRYESGQSEPSVSHSLAIARALGTTVEEAFGDDGQRIDQRQGHGSALRLLPLRLGVTEAAEAKGDVDRREGRPRRQLARALTERELSDQLLAHGVETALKLLDDRA
jgi:transcriptional regulator with XRE-family HTH domain